MIPSPLDPKYVVRVNVRPLRHAYFIPGDDTRAFTDAAQFSCTQWGGQKNIIVPLRAGTPVPDFFRQVLRLTEPDIFVSSLGEAATRDQVVPLLSALWPGRKIDIIPWDQFLETDSALHPLGILPPVAKRPLAVYEFDDGPHHAHLMAAFGAIYPGQEALYSDELQVERRSIGVLSEAFWEAQHQRGVFDSVVNLTTREVGAYRCSNFWQTNSFSLVLANSVESLAMYWALRAVAEAALVDWEPPLGRRTLLIAEENLASREQLSSLVDFLRRRLPVPGMASNLQLYLHAWNQRGHDLLRDAFSSIPGLRAFDAPKIECQLGMSGGSSLLEDFSKKPISFAFQPAPYPQSFREGVGKSRDSSKLVLLEGENEVPLLVPPQLKFLDGKIAFDIESRVWDRYPKSALLAERIVPKAWWSRYGVTFRRFGADLSGKSLAIHLPTEWDALDLYFKERGYDIRLSQGGRSAAAFVELIGGIEEVGVLASEPAIAVLKVLARLSRKKLAQRLARQNGMAQAEAEACASRIPDEIFRDVLSACTLDDLRSKAGTAGQELLALVGQLTSRHIARRGFFLECPRCGTKSWYPMDGLRINLECPGCSFGFEFPVEYPPGSGREIAWYYTLNTLVDAIMDQDGLPALLALYALTRKLRGTALVPGLEISRLGEKEPFGELDFVLVVKGRLFAGECKAASELEDKDIERAVKAQSLGAASFYFCTPNQFSESAIGRIEELKKEMAGKMSIEVLDKTVLLQGSRERAKASHSGEDEAGLWL
jgi:hypothetical protein